MNSIFCRELLAFALSILMLWTAPGMAQTQEASKVRRTGAPYVAYTDTLSAPVSGGEDGLGGYLSIFGINFGSPSELGAHTKVLVGDTEVANYRYLGPSKVYEKLGLQQITVQVGKLRGATIGQALPISVVVNGVASNTTNTFTPTSGKVLFVSLNGNDATAVANDINKPWRHLQNSGAGQGAYYAMGAGDQVVLRGGNWSDINGKDGTWMRFSQTSLARNGNARAWLHITAHPGPIKGNAIEAVHYTTPAGAAGGIAGPWRAIAGTSGEYVSVSNLRMDVSGGAASDAAPINLQYTDGPWRVVNNELGPWIAGSSSKLRAAGVSGHGDNIKVLGNHIHHIEGTSALENHGVYADTKSQNWEIAYNWIHDISGGSLVQFNDNEGGAGNHKLHKTDETWLGFTGIRVHHNWLERAAKFGVNFSDQRRTEKGIYEAQVWNNVIIGTKLPPLRIKSSQPTQKLWFAFNTIYDCMTTHSGGGNAMVRTEGDGAGAQVNNRFYNNIFAFGPRTIAGTQWLVSDGPTAPTANTYDFKRNLYHVHGQSPKAPSAIGDGAAIVANPQFKDPTRGDLTPHANSPARRAATYPLPAGFVLPIDVRQASRHSSANPLDIGAFDGQ